jgi:DNA-binding NarL/FixJ family response regulator
MYQNIKVIIADDHDLFRDGLKLLLRKAEGIEVIGEARNGEELVGKALQLNPDVILTDLVMPGKSGAQAIEELYERGFERIIAISNYESDQMIVDALQAGAIGYLVKNAKKDEIITAIQAAFEYKNYYCKSTSGRLSGLIDELKLNLHAKKKRELFREEEKSIIQLICEEKTSKEISKLLFISKRTVDGIRSRILTKMNVKTNVGVAIYAIRHAIYIIKPESGESNE